MRILTLCSLCLLSSCTMDRGFFNRVDPLVEDTDADTTGGVDQDVLKDTGSVHGRICAPSGTSWVGGAQVWIEHPDGRIADTFSDSEGWFMLTGVEPGIHTLRVQKGSFTTDFQVEVFVRLTTELPEEECLKQGGLQIAVVTGKFDKIERILDRLGLEYDLIDGLSGYDHVRLLTDESALREYDMVFLNCGMNENWMPDERVVAQNLQSFVGEGGSVYTSDMTYALMEAAYPDAIDFLGIDEELYHSNQVLGPLTVNADVVDKELERSLGSDEVEVRYEASGYYAAGLEVGTATPLIRAHFNYHPNQDSQVLNTYGVLVATQHVGTGRIIFTSFHNEAQNPGSVATMKVSTSGFLV